MRSFGRAVVLTAAALSVVGWGAVDAVAATVSCGQVIGSTTTVGNDLTNCPGPGLVIGADNITLDLGGHTIDGDGGVEARDIGVANGIVYDTGSGVFEEPAHSGVTVKNGAIRDFGLAGANSGFDPNFAGQALATGNLFSNLNLSNAGIGLLYTDDSRVENNTLSGGGIGVVGSSRNNVVGNTLVGGSISVTSFEVRGGRGANDNVVSRNTVKASTRNGVYIGHGLPESWPSPTGTRILENNVSASANDGILVDAFDPDFPAGAVGTVLDGNRANGNGDDGIDVDAPSTTIGASTANSNTDLGIEAVAGVTDAGGNHAQGNGNPAQCTNVSCDTSTLILFGRRVAGGSFSAMSAQAKRASPFTVYFPITVKKLSAYIDGGGATSGSQVMRAVIYRHSSGGPGELVARSFQVTIAAGRGPGWVDLYLPFPPRLQSGVYWLGIHSGASHGIARFAWDPAANSRRFNVDGFGDGPSNPFGSAPVDNQQMSIYASGSY